MGTNAVGAMIVAGPTGFMKTHYRTFTIKSEEVKPGDDYGMMREVLQRRFARLVKEHPRTKAEAGMAAAAGGPSEPEAAPDPSDTDAFPAWPDLVLIDGGRGQLEAARKALDEVGVTDVPLVGIAKGRDRMRDARPSSCPARRRSGCRPGTRRSTSSSACATRPTASPSGRTGPSASARW